MKTSGYLTPRLHALYKELEATLPRLDDQTDERAVHDMRVALRRLRSLLREVRSVYGKFHTDAVHAALKSIADASGTLRDEEALRETLHALTLSSPAHTEIEAWLAKRSRLCRVLRQKLVRLVHEGALKHALTWLQALLALPVKPSRDKAVEPFAHQVAYIAWQRVERRLDTDVDQVKPMHKLRILWKRLRYAIEGFDEVLSPKLRPIAKLATQSQKHLGKLHDLDMALALLQQAADLPTTARAEMLQVISDRRHSIAAKYRVNLGARAKRIRFPSNPAA